jgi:hypothetical protein
MQSIEILIVIVLTQYLALTSGACQSWDVGFKNAWAFHISPFFINSLTIDTKKID